MIKLSVVGKDIERVDGLAKVTGTAQFCADIKDRVMLSAKVLRSPYAHARVLSINTSKAEKLLGVRGIVKPEDAPERRTGGYRVLDRLVLPRDRVVRFVGEPVCVVVADDSIIAEEALELVEVDYVELPALFDAKEAMSRCPPVVLHPEKHSYPSIFAKSALKEVPDLPNVATTYALEIGDAERGLKEADLVVENTFSFGRAQQCRLEPYVCDAWVESDGTFAVRTAKAGIWRTHGQLATLLNMPPSKLRVMSSYVGGNFGGKGAPIVECLTLLAAMKTGKPVRLEYDREEEFIDSGLRPEITVYIKDGVKKNGVLVARVIRIIIDAGAYAALGPSVSPFYVLLGTFGCYRIPNFRSTAYSVYTNNPPSATFRGVEAGQGSWAIESQMDIIARELDIDPLELRLRNLVHEGDKDVFGQVLQQVHPKECLEKAAELIDWGKGSQPGGKWKAGKGLAIADWRPVTNFPAYCTVRILRDGAIEVRTGADEVGQGLHTVLAQIAAEEFGVPLPKIRIVYGDTLHTPWDWAAIGSRATWNTGNALIQACQDAKQQLFRLAARQLGVSHEDLDLRGGIIYHKLDAAKTIPLSNLLTEDGLLGRGVYRYTAPEADVRPQEELTAAWSYQAYGVEVGVNVETGEIKVLRVGAAVDIGRPINWKMCEGQIEGGIGMGIGTSIYERLVVEHGRVINPFFYSYYIPKATEIPSGEAIKSFAIESVHPDGPYGAKAIGEMTLLPFAAAVGNAVVDAVGIRIKQAPLTRENVYNALREQFGSSILVDKGNS
jgi:CO/xanthine dehydrogenase Mo-binding subunit